MARLIDDLETWRPRARCDIVGDPDAVDRLIANARKNLYDTRCCPARDVAYPQRLLHSHLQALGLDMLAWRVNRGEYTGT